MTLKSDDRSGELRDLMAQRILVLDGATGTMLQSRSLTAEDFGGAELEGCNEHLVVSRPDVIIDVHREYLSAGADIIETNTFGGTSIVLDEYGLGDRAVELNRLAAEIACRAATEASSPGRPRFVGGSVGPTTKAITVTGGITFPELVATYSGQVKGLLEGGVDLFLVETCQDTRNAKAALIAIEEVCREYGVRRPVCVAGTIEMTGTMLAGQTAEAFAASLSHVNLLAIGLNCATGPEFMTDHLRGIHGMVDCAVSCYPNAGLPDEDGRYLETPEKLAAALERFADNGWLNMVGGCCGTDASHIAAIAAMVGGKTPRRAPERRTPRTFYTGVDLVEASDDNRPLLVGERTNVIGSRKFKRLIAEERWEEAAEIARRQVKGGAQIVDVCLQTTDRDELADIHLFYERLIRTVRAPIMIDTTDAEAVALALTYCQGKAIVNSINLEDGEERFQSICPLLARYGAAVVVGTIDEDPDQAQAFTRERKLAVAKRSHDLLVNSYGIPEQDIIFDPLTFPAASGDEAYVGGAVETIEGLRLIKQAFPAAKTVLGISNVSFGLPPAAREVLNSVFLYYCTLAGLDMAIVNSQKLERFAGLREDERRMAEDLLFNRPLSGSEAPEDWREQSPEQRAAINRQHIETMAEHFRGVKKEARTRPDMPLDERLASYIIEGIRDGLVDDLQEKLDEGAVPLDIINGPLMSGMAEVGRLFNSNQLIVAEVLRSAESMKAAVSFLEKFMEADESTTRGKVVLATVKGDVHDIGKNLVEIIFANNGYEVVNLGIKVPPGKLIEAALEHEPDAIGLSGLLVKSAQQMVATAEDLRVAGIGVPILVGGAALSGKFTRTRIAPVYDGGVLYCPDAMAGLHTMNRLMDDAERAALLSEHAAEEPAPRPDRKPAPSAGSAAAVAVRAEARVLPAPYGERRVISPAPDLDEIWAYLNPQMLFGKHLGLRGSVPKKLAEGDPKAHELRRLMITIRADAKQWMKVRAVWRFFEAETEGETISLYEAGAEQPVASFTFPRQDRAGRLCLADYVAAPAERGRDSVALFVVTAGEGVRERAEQTKQAGEYLESHALQALALETAEAAAEWLHASIRELWGFPDPPDMSMRDRFAARYRGKRFSPGYPACPDLDDQAGIFALLEPGEIGVNLTDSMMMDPEASVSAYVFHHPAAKYFSV